MADDGRVVKVPSDRAAPDRALAEGLAALGGPRPPDVLAHGTTVATNALLERRGGRVALVATPRVRRRDRDRPPAPAVALRPVRRPAPAPRRARRPARGRRPARRRRAGARPRRRGHGPAMSTSGSTRSPCASSTPTSTRGPSARSPGSCASRGLVVELLARGVARVPRVRAHGHDRRRRDAPAGLPRVPRRRRRARDRGAGHDVGRWPRAARRRRPAPGHPPPLGPGRRGAGRGRRSRPRCGTPTRSPSTWAARAPTCASCGAASPKRPRAAPSAGSRSASPRSTSTPSAPAAGRSPGSTRAVRSSWGRAARARSPVRPRTAGAGPSRPSPTPTSCSAASPPTRSSPASARSTPAAARSALTRAGVDPAGVVAVVDASMEQAVRRVTVERGVDPRGVALVAFGGAGPLHACAVADGLGIPVVIVPPRGGCSRRSASSARPAGSSWSARGRRPATDAGLDDALDALARRAGAEVPDSTVARFVDCRYAGQSHELTVADPAAFAEEHERRNGYALPGRAVEVVALRARASGPDPGTLAALPPPARCARRRPRGRGRGRLHGLGSRRLGGGTRPARRLDPGAITVTADGRPAPTGLDPASLQVLVARLTGVADEMGVVLRRAAFSPNIKERADCSAAVFTPDGELLVQAEHIPVHLGSMPAAVRAAIDACGSTIRPGDQIVLNDPFAGGTHLNDVTFVAPCIVDDELVGWVANRAHHADLGGMAPGSMPPDATEIAQEGLRVPPVRFTPEVEAVFVASSRTPDERRGDLAAQLGANVSGVAPARGVPRRTVRRDRRLRRAAHAGRARRSARRHLARARRARLGRAASRPADTDAGRAHVDRRRRHRHVRLHRDRRAASGQRQRGAGRDRECRRVRAPGRDRSDHPRERRRAPTGARRRARRDRGRGRPTRRGRRRATWR